MRDRLARSKTEQPNGRISEAVAAGWSRSGRNGFRKTFHRALLGRPELRTHVYAFMGGMALLGLLCAGCASVETQRVHTF